MAPKSILLNALLLFIAVLLVGGASAAGEDGHGGDEAHADSDHGTEDAHMSDDGHGAAEPTEPVLGPDQLAGESWSWTFDGPGEFIYHCHPHPWMEGHITILPSDGSDPQTHQVEIVEPEDPEAWRFAPQEITIRAGDTVVWNNTGDIMHKIAEMTDEHAGMHGGSASSHDVGLGTSADDHTEEGEDHGTLGTRVPGLTGPGGAAVTGVLSGVIVSFVVIIWMNRAGA